MKNYRRSPKFCNWVKKFRARKYRHRIKQEIRKYQKDWQISDLHLPQIKDLFDPWAWD